ncbi:MAG: exo-alpha-sialidase [Verrucomicrobiae bacterium]|nr:exo-alpha-sialidase [Verrucomicrobiae bacterium]
MRRSPCYFALHLAFLPLGAAEIPFLDLAEDHYRQVVVDHEAGLYLGHPTTALLDDGKTLLTVYPKGHGRGGIVYKRSPDGGLSWSERLPTPASWATSLEVPTLHRMTDAGGTKRIVMFSGLYPVRSAHSEDDGKTWSELAPIGDWGGIVTMGCHFEVRGKPGHYRVLFHDDGRFIRADSKQEKPVVFTLYSSTTTDGGLTWGQPETIYSSSEVHLCEPGVIRSPDGKSLVVLLRENARRKNSHVIFSDDEGETWSPPRELPVTLTGDRHTGKYGPDGRLLISFRGITPGMSRVRGTEESTGPMPTAGDWAAWVGTWEDLVDGKPGQYVVRLMDNHKGADTAYPGVEILPDGTFVLVTYGHWTAGEEPYLMCVRLRLEELDEKAARSSRIQLSEDGMKVVTTP